MTHSEMREQIVKSWKINNQVNLLLLKDIPEEALLLTLSGKSNGTSILRQFTHMHNIRYYRIQKMTPDLSSKCTKIAAGNKIGKEGMHKHLLTSHDLIREGMLRALDHGKVPGYPAGLIPFLCYIVNHEAHHRGKILLTLKNNRIPFSTNLKYSIWDWNRIQNKF